MCVLVVMHEQPAQLRCICFLVTRCKTMSKYYNLYFWCYNLLKEIFHHLMMLLYLDSFGIWSSGKGSFEESLRFGGVPA